MHPFSYIQGKGNWENVYFKWNILSEASVRSLAVADGEVDPQVDPLQLTHSETICSANSIRARIGPSVPHGKRQEPLTSDRKVCADFCAPTCSRYSYTYSASLERKGEGEGGRGGRVSVFSPLALAASPKRGPNQRTGGAGSLNGYLNG